MMVASWTDFSSASREQAENTSAEHENVENSVFNFISPRIYTHKQAMTFQARETTSNLSLLELGEATGDAAWIANNARGSLLDTYAGNLVDELKSNDRNLNALYTASGATSQPPPNRPATNIVAARANLALEIANRMAKADLGLRDALLESGIAAALEPLAHEHAEKVMNLMTSIMRSPVPSYEQVSSIFPLLCRTVKSDGASPLCVANAEPQHPSSIPSAASSAVPMRKCWDRVRRVMRSLSEIAARRPEAANALRRMLVIECDQMEINAPESRMTIVDLVHQCHTITKEGPTAATHAWQLIGTLLIRPAKNPAEQQNIRMLARTLAQKGVFDAARLAVQTGNDETAMHAIEALNKILLARSGETQEIAERAVRAAPLLLTAMAQKIGEAMASVEQEILVFISTLATICKEIVDRQSITEDAPRPIDDKAVERALQSIRSTIPDVMAAVDEMFTMHCMEEDPSAVDCSNAVTAFEFLHGLLVSGDGDAFAAADSIAKCHGWEVIERVIKLLEQDDALEMERTEILELAYMLRSARGRLATSQVEQGRTQHVAEEAG